MRIYLLGFMGSGKTRLGKKLAQLMEYPFLDLDQLIIEKEQSSINDIFDESGEAYFRQLEQKVLYESLQYNDAVIATGGGTPCYFDNMEWINQHGLSIYLDADSDILLNRLWKGRHKRPLIKKLSKHELQIFIEKKINERKLFYLQAAIRYQILIEDQKSAEELILFLKF